MNFIQGYCEATPPDVETITKHRVDNPKALINVGGVVHEVRNNQINNKSLIKIVTSFYR